MGCDNNLASFAAHRIEKRNQAQAGVKGKRCFRLVEKVHAHIFKAMPQHGEKAFAVRARLHFLSSVRVALTAPVDL